MGFELEARDRDRGRMCLEADASCGLSFLEKYTLSAGADAQIIAR